MRIVTLADLRRKAIHHCEGDPNARSPSQFPVDLMDAWLSEAYLRVQDETAILRGRLTQNLVLDQLYYAQPTNPPCLNMRVSRTNPLTLLLGTDQRSFPKLMLFDEMRRSYPLDDPISGTPAFFAFARSEGVQSGMTRPRIAIYPPAPASVTNGFILEYVAEPNQLDTVYESETDDEDSPVTADVENASPTVTLAATPTETIIAGMAFGVKTTAAGWPKRWYRIQSVAGAVLTLSEDFEGTSDDTALWIIASTSDFEWAYPRLVGEAASAYFAMQYERQTHHGSDAHAMAEKAWFDELARIRNETLKINEPPTRRNHASIVPTLGA